MTYKDSKESKDKVFINEKEFLKVAFPLKYKENKSNHATLLGAFIDTMYDLKYFFKDLMLIRYCRNIGIREGEFYYSFKYDFLKPTGERNFEYAIQGNRKGRSSLTKEVNIIREEVLSNHNLLRGKCTPANKRNTVYNAYFNNNKIVKCIKKVFKEYQTHKVWFKEYIVLNDRMKKSLEEKLCLLLNEKIRVVLRNER